MDTKFTVSHDMKTGMLKMEGKRGGNEVTVMVDHRTTSMEEAKDKVVMALDNIEKGKPLNFVQGGDNVEKF